MAPPGARQVGGSAPLGQRVKLRGIAGDGTVITAANGSVTKYPDITKCYEEIDQIYDYIRGLAPLPLQLRKIKSIDFEQLERDRQLRRATNSGSTTKLQQNLTPKVHHHQQQDASFPNGLIIKPQILKQNGPTARATTKVRQRQVDSTNDDENLPLPAPVKLLTTSSSESRPVVKRVESLNLGDISNLTSGYTALKRNLPIMTNFVSSQAPMTAGASKQITSSYQVSNSDEHKQFRLPRAHSTSTLNKPHLRPVTSGPNDEPSRGRARRVEALAEADEPRATPMATRTLPGLRHSRTTTLISDNNRPDGFESSSLSRLALRALNKNGTLPSLEPNESETIEGFVDDEEIEAEVETKKKADQKWKLSENKAETRYIISSKQAPSQRVLKVPSSSSSSSDSSQSLASSTHDARRPKSGKLTDKSHSDYENETMSSMSSSSADSSSDTSSESSCRNGRRHRRSSSGGGTGASNERSSSSASRSSPASSTSGEQSEEERGQEHIYEQIPSQKLRQVSSSGARRQRLDLGGATRRAGETFSQRQFEWRRMQLQHQQDKLTQEQPQQQQQQQQKQRQKQQQQQQIQQQQQLLQVRRASPRQRPASCHLGPARNQPPLKPVGWAAVARAPRASGTSGRLSQHHSRLSMGELQQLPVGPLLLRMRGRTARLSPVGRVAPPTRSQAPATGELARRVLAWPAVGRPTGATRRARRLTALGIEEALVRGATPCLAPEALGGSGGERGGVPLIDADAEEGVPAATRSRSARLASRIPGSMSDLRQLTGSSSGSSAPSVGRARQVTDRSPGATAGGGGAFVSSGSFIKCFYGREAEGQASNVGPPALLPVLSRPRSRPRVFPPVQLVPQFEPKPERGRGLGAPEPKASGKRRVGLLGLIGLHTGSSARPSESAGHRGRQPRLFEHPGVRVVKVAGGAGVAQQAPSRRRTVTSQAAAAAAAAPVGKGGRMGAPEQHTRPRQVATPPVAEDSASSSSSTASSYEAAIKNSSLHPIASAPRRERPAPGAATPPSQGQPGQPHHVLVGVPKLSRQSHLLNRPLPRPPPRAGPPPQAAAVPAAAPPPTNRVRRSTPICTNLDAATAPAPPAEQASSPSSGSDSSSSSNLDAPSSERITGRRGTIPSLPGATLLNQPSPTVTTCTSSGISSRLTSGTHLNSTERSSNVALSQRSTGSRAKTGSARVNLKPAAPLLPSSSRTDSPELELIDADFGLGRAEEKFETTNGSVKKTGEKLCSNLRLFDEKFSAKLLDEPRLASSNDSLLESINFSGTLQSSSSNQARRLKAKTNDTFAGSRQKQPSARR